MFYGDTIKRDTAKDAFMLKKNPNTGELLYKDQPDTFIELMEIMETGVNLYRATVIIICESIYDLKLFKQISKRNYRQGNFQEISYYGISAHTIIKKIVDKKRKIKFDFTINVFKTVKANVA